MNFFYYVSKFNIFFFLFGGVGGGLAGGARVSEFGLGGGGTGGGVDGWTVEQAQTNLPLQLLRSWEHDNELMYKLCP